MRASSSYPKTLGEFHRLGWIMRASCSRCDLTETWEVDFPAVIAQHGADYSTGELMLNLMCDHCGDKLGLLNMSPEEQKPIFDRGDTWGDQLDRARAKQMR